MALMNETGARQRLAAILGFAGTMATIGGALMFQYLGGYLPCKLCLEQRIPYYLAVPILAAAVVAHFTKAPPLLSRLLLLAGGLLMVWSLYLATFHTGVEWGWWPGPTDCGAIDPAPSAGGPVEGGGVLDALNTVIPPSCDQAALTILGLSLAAWNVLISAVLAVILLRGALTRPQ